jgi:hypothetical protein
MVAICRAIIAKTLCETIVFDLFIFVKFIDLSLGQLEEALFLSPYLLGQRQFYLL